MEERSYPSGSVLWKRNISDWSGDDGSKHCAGYESFFYCGGMDQSDSKERMVWRCQWGEWPDTGRRGSRHPGIWYWSGRGKSCEKECRRCRRGSYDSFSTESRAGSAPSEEIRVYHHKSAVWRASWGEKGTSEVIFWFWRKFPYSGFMVSVYDHKLWRCRALFWKKSRQK